MLIPWIFFVKEDEQLMVESFTKRWVVNGPKVFLCKPMQQVQRRTGITLSPTEYARICDNVTGHIHNEVGPKLYFLKVNETVMQRFRAVPLKQNQYIRLLDTQSGEVRVERGESVVYLKPTEEILEDVSEGVNIDDHTAVVIRDTESGNLSLVTEPQVFVPSSHQEIVEVINRIRLQDHEVMVIKDRHGRYLLRRGTDAERSFFLDPYEEVVPLWWSTGLHKEKRNLKITRIDLRPKFMWYEFEARSQDNVEIVLGITFFWQIVDVESMIKTSDDGPGDICSHARSAIIQSISKVTLEDFLANFNSIVRQAVLGDEDPFYDERGITLHAVEVRSISCKDPKTQQILQEIIQETTNRLNLLQKQEGENQVRVKKIDGEIVAEEMQAKLLAAKRDNMQTAAQMDGQAAATRTKAFFDGLGDQLSATDKIAIYNTLRKQEMLETLSEGTAQLYFTPADVDLSIESKAS